MPIGNFYGIRHRKTKPLEMPKEETSVKDFFESEEIKAAFFLHSKSVQDVDVTEEHKELYQNLHDNYLFQQQPQPSQQHDDDDDTTNNEQGNDNNNDNNDNNNKKKKIFPMKPTDKVRVVLAEEKPNNYAFAFKVCIQNYFWIQLDMAGDGSYAEENELGSLNFTLIESKKTAAGIPLLVRMFDKMNDLDNDGKTIDDNNDDNENDKDNLVKEQEEEAKGKEEKEEETTTSTTTSTGNKKHKTPGTISFNQMRAIKTNDGKLVFYSTVEVAAKVKVPDGMLRFMPISMKRMEKIGNGTIAKILDKGGKETIDAVEKIYLEWLKKNTQQQQQQQQNAAQ